jgi:DNA-binding CsgD family transcriptional regulator
MVLSQSEQRALARVFAALAESAGEREMRERVGMALLDLLRADHFASYVWDARRGVFGDGVWLNMDPANLARYEAWYQHRDPITFALQARRHATAVSEVMAHRELRRCEFFNDFLARDGLHWGINLHAFDSDERALGDLRIWRGRRRREFEPHDKALLDLIEPAFIAALRRARVADAGPLSAREQQVARCVAQGLTDKEIARELGIAVSSVRTYLRRMADKCGVKHRAGIARLV